MQGEHGRNIPPPCSSGSCDMWSAAKPTKRREEAWAASSFFLFSRERFGDAIGCGTRGWWGWRCHGAVRRSMEIFGRRVWRAKSGAGASGARAGTGGGVASARPPACDFATSQIPIPITYPMGAPIRILFFSFLFPTLADFQCVVSRLQKEATLADFGRAPRGALRCRRGISCRSRPPLLPPLRCRWKSGPSGGRGDDARRFFTTSDGLLHAWPQLHVLRLDCSSCFSFALISRQRSSRGGGVS
jgi:hypothetical protein